MKAWCVIFPFLLTLALAEEPVVPGNPSGPRPAAGATPSIGKHSSGSKGKAGSLKLKYAPAPPAHASAPPVPEAQKSPAKRALPFSSKVISVDKAHGRFRMGKKVVREVRVGTDTKLFRGDGVSAARFSDIVVGMEVRGSLHRGEKGVYEAVSLKIGPKKSPAADAAADDGDTIP